MGVGCQGWICSALRPEQNKAEPIRFDPTPLFPHKNFKNCTYTNLGLNKNNHELAGNYIQLFQNFYKNTNFSALSNCFPDNFDQESLRAISKVALNQDEKFLEEFLSEIEKLLKTKNFENLVKFVVILDNSRDEQIYVGNFYAGLKKAIKELKNGKIDGLKQFFAYSDCLSKRENFTYSDLVDITPSDFYASGVSFDDLWSMAVCNGQASLKAMALEEIQERGLEVFDWGMKLLSATFGEDEEKVDRQPLTYPAPAAPGQENESPVGIRKRRNATVDFDYQATTPTEPKKMPKTSDLIKQLPTLLSSLFTFDMENFGTIEAWNTRIKKLQSQLENNQCLVKFFATEKMKKKLKKVHVCEGTASFKKFYNGRNCVSGVWGEGDLKKKPSRYPESYDKTKFNKNEGNHENHHHENHNHSPDFNPNVKMGGKLDENENDNNNKNNIQSNEDKDDDTNQISTKSAVRAIIENLSDPVKVGILIVLVLIILGLILLCKQATSGGRRRNRKESAESGRQNKNNKNQNKHQKSKTPPQIYITHHAHDEDVTPYHNNNNDMQKAVCMSDVRASGPQEPALPAYDGSATRL